VVLVDLLGAVPGCEKGLVDHPHPRQVHLDAQEHLEGGDRHPPRLEGAGEVRVEALAPHHVEEGLEGVRVGHDGPGADLLALAVELDAAGPALPGCHFLGLGPSRARSRYPGNRRDVAEGFR
jgi:hypothetical protein